MVKKSKYGAHKKQVLLNMCVNSDRFEYIKNRFTNVVLSELDNVKCNSQILIEALDKSRKKEKLYGKHKIALKDYFDFLRSTEYPFKASGKLIYGSLPKLEKFIVATNLQRLITRKILKYENKYYSFTAKELDLAFYSKVASICGKEIENTKFYVEFQNALKQKQHEEYLKVLKITDPISHAQYTAPGMFYGMPIGRDFTKIEQLESQTINEITTLKTTKKTKREVRKGKSRMIL
jgi:hypothetical protein